MIGLALFAASAAVFMEPTSDEQDVALPAAKYFTETKDRLSSEQMELLVEAPMAEVREGRLRAGEDKFEQLLARAQGTGGSMTLGSADLQTAFGVALYVEAKENGDEAVAIAAIDHLKLAEIAYTKLFGRRHPEVALALTTLADGMGELSEDKWLPERIPLYREALSIREATLGPNHPETLASLGDLANVLIDNPAADEPAKSEALTLFTRAAANAPAHVPPGHDISRSRFEIGRADALAAIGRTDEAFQTADNALKAVGPEPGPECFSFVSRVKEVAVRLRTAGAPQDADALLKRAQEGCPISVLLDLLSETDPTE